MNTYAIVPRKCFEQMDPLMQQAIPGFSFLVLKGRVAIGSPLLKERGSAILFAEVGTQCVLKAPSEGHARARFFFLPAVQIAIPIASRTPQVLADLRVAIDHRRLLAPCFVPGTRNREPPNLPPGRTLRGFDRNARLRSYRRSERRRGDGAEPCHPRGHP